MISKTHFHPHCKVVITGIWTSMLSLVGMVSCMVMMMTENTWSMLVNKTEVWLQANQWDIKMTQAVAKLINWVDWNHREVLAILMIITVFHFIVSVMLILSSVFYKKILIIPWLVSHMVNMIIMIITFTCWTFIAFFIDLLMAIIFPLVAGLVIGLWIVMWREVLHFSLVLRESEKQLQTIFMMETEYKKVDIVK